MELNKATISSLFLVVLLLASQAAPGVEAKVCKSPSAGFKGLCFRDANCAQICVSEGYQGGDCHGIRRRCICRKHC